MKILVLNCGSSSIKYQLFDMRPAGDLELDGTPATLIAADALSAIEHAIDCEEQQHGRAQRQHGGQDLA